MAGSLISTFPAGWTFEDVLRQLGDIPARRIHAVPALGLATEEDLLAEEARTGRICELIDGALVEKTRTFPRGSVTKVVPGVSPASTT